MSPVEGAPTLLADIGATHARFALCRGGTGPSRLRVLPAVEYGDFESAARAYLGREQVETTDLGAAVVAVAAPVHGDEIALTNLGWRFSVEETRRSLGIARLVAINDFAALALSLPALGEADLETIAAGEPARDRALAVIGPGTGLGVGGLLPTPGGEWLPVESEGGHRDLAATDDREWQVVQRLRARFGHASAERAISGPGLAAIDAALREADGLPPARLAPEEVSARARGHGDPHAVEAARLFSGWLGAVAGDLALTLGARGGVFLAGGALAGLGGAFDRELFVERFRSKGRFREYLTPIPIHRITRVDASLVGLARALSG